MAGSSAFTIAIRGNRVLNPGCVAHLPHKYLLIFTLAICVSMAKSYFAIDYICVIHW